LGLQASGLPSGAHQVPLIVPCEAVKLHACPLLKVLHDASASAGGLGGAPLPSVGWAKRVQLAASAPEKMAALRMRLVRARFWWVVFIK
jgi:hypothetical protein